MNGENKQKTSWLRPVIVFLGALGVHILFLLIGAGLCHGFSYAGILYNASSALLVILPAGSAAASVIYSRRLKKKNVREMNEQVDQQLKRMEQDVSREWKRLHRACRITAGYVGILLLLCISVSFFYGASSEKGNIYGCILSVFLMTGYVGRISCSHKKAEIAPPLPEKDYPQLYALVREAAGEEWRSKPIHIHVIHDIPDQECNAALALEKKEVSLWIGAVLLCVLDEGELRQVLLHEFAHLDKTDTEQNARFNRIMGFLTKETNVFLAYALDLAFTFPILYLQRNGQLYFLLSSREKESRADRRAALQGDPEKQASALAKIHGHNLFVLEQEPYVNLFVSEQVPQHLMTDRARAFRDALTVRGDAWKHILENEIPSRVDTHPTFRQRWEALGCCNYSFVPASMDTQFARECWKAAETADTERASIPLEQYEEMRRESYLKPLEVIREFEAADKKFSPDELRPVMNAYFQLGMPEKMEALCDSVLAEQESPFAAAFSNHWKGTLLLYRYDKTGIDYLYQAMEANTNYIESGLDRIGSFCTRMGLQQELEEYRQRAPEFLQQIQDRQNDGITSRAKLTQAELPEGWRDQICGFITTVAGDTIEKIYLVQERVSADYQPSAFVLRFREETPDEKVQAVYERVFSLLDDWPVDWEFSLYVFEPGMEKVLEQVEGSCVFERKDGR